MRSKRKRARVIGNTVSYTYDFGTKVANSVAECPLKLYRGQIDPNNPPAPGDAAWVEETRQSALDKLKMQNELPITSTNVSGRTAVYNGQTYVTQDASHPACRDDYAGKVYNSTTVNPHITKHNHMSSNTILLGPSEFTTESSQSGYDGMLTLDGVTAQVSAQVNDAIPQRLLAFNIVEMYKRKFGYIPADGTLVGEIDWLKKNLSTITCNGVGYGVKPSGNHICMKWFLQDGSNTWNGTPGENIASSPANFVRSIDAGNIYRAIDSNGFVYFLIYTDASDGVTASTVYLDYANIELQVASEAGYDTLVPPNPRRDSVTAPNYDTVLSLAKAYANITTDYTGKVSGSVVENANLFRRTTSNAGQTTLLSPTVFASTYAEVSDYTGINTLNGNVTYSFTTTNGQMSQHLFAFNIIADVEKIIGAIPITLTGVPATDLASKRQWVKDNVYSFSCTHNGYGSCPAGNKSNLTFWTGTQWYTTPMTHSSASVQQLAFGLQLADWINSIDSNGFVYFLAYTDASNGTIASQINTDYIKFTIIFKQPTTAVELMTQNSVDVDVQIANKASAYLIEVDLAPVCDNLHGGNNAAMRAAMASLVADIWCLGQGALNAQVNFTCSEKVWTRDNAWGLINSLAYTTLTKTSINRATQAGAAYIVSNTNKVYIMMHPYASDGTIPSSVSLDFIQATVSFTRVADVVSPVPVVIPADGKFAVVGRFSPAWDTTTVSSVKRILTLYKDSNNWFICDFNNNTKQFEFRKKCNGVEITRLVSVTQTINKFQIVGFGLQQTDVGMILHILKNNGTLEKYTNADVQKITGLLNMYPLMWYDGTVQGDGLFDFIKPLPSVNMSDTEVENSLRGIDAGGITTQFAQPELFDINKVTLHANATRANGVITLNATANYQSSPIDISVLPNNKYEFKIALGGYVDVNNKPYIAIADYYNSIMLRDNFNSGYVEANGDYVYTVTTSDKTNKFKITLTDKGSGTFTFSNISLKLKM
jgi:hypothetical protein